jgi:2-oxoglutarate-Fe(II)-dependent oxygenase superfamily protein
VPIFIGQLTRSGFKFPRPATGDTRSRARAEFRTSRHLLFERFIEPGLLDEWQRRITGAPFKPRVAKGEWGDKPPSEDLRVDDRVVWGGCIFALNDATLFQVVEDLTACVSIGSFFGSVYRIVAGMGHFHTWHNDLDGNRLIALSVNLSRDGYRGGVLQIAERNSKRLLAEVANTGYGDAVIFEISEDLEHRVTEVDAGPDKTAFAGWFVRSPARADLLRRALGPGVMRRG